MLIPGFKTAPGYAIEVVSCSGFEACPDGSPPFTNAFLELAAEVEALTAEVEALKALLADVTHGTDPNTSQDTLTFSGMRVKYVYLTGPPPCGPFFWQKPNPCRALNIQDAVLKSGHLLVLISILCCLNSNYLLSKLALSLGP